MVQIFGILVAGYWQREKSFVPILRRPLLKWVSLPLELNRNSLVDLLTFRLVCDSKSVGHRRECQKP